MVAMMCPPHRCGWLATAAPPPLLPPLRSKPYKRYPGSGRPIFGSAGRRSGASACGAGLGVDDRDSADDMAFHGLAGGGLVAVAERPDDELVIVVPGGHRGGQRPRDAGGVDQQV